MGGQIHSSKDNIVPPFGWSWCFGWAGLRLTKTCMIALILDFGRKFWLVNCLKLALAILVTLALIGALAKLHEAKNTQTLLELVLDISPILAGPSI